MASELGTVASREEVRAANGYASAEERGTSVRDLTGSIDVRLDHLAKALSELEATLDPALRPLPDKALEVRGEPVNTVAEKPVALLVSHLRDVDAHVVALIQRTHDLTGRVQL